MNEIQLMLSYINVDDREEWVMAGMAVHSAIGDAGFDLWNQWSSQGRTYNQQSARSVWRSFKTGGGITIRSLAKIARDNGYRGEINTKQYTRPAPNDDDKRIIEAQNKAATIAQNLIKQCRHERGHEYLDFKGLGHVTALIKGDLIHVPMRVNNRVVGVQRINSDGVKKFLLGQKSSGASFDIGNGDLDIFCEGYATGLTAFEIASKFARVRVHVCFSDHNMVKVSNQHENGIVIADNDVSGAGLKAALKTGKPYWISENVGNDLNDDWRSAKIKTALNFQKFVMNLKK